MRGVYPKFTPFILLLFILTQMIISIINKIHLYNMYKKKYIYIFLYSTKKNWRGYSLVIITWTIFSLISHHCLLKVMNILMKFENFFRKFVVHCFYLIYVINLYIAIQGKNALVLSNLGTLGTTNLVCIYYIKRAQLWGSLMTHVHPSNVFLLYFS